MDCIDIFPAGVCIFLTDPWGYIFSALAAALSLPLIWIAHGVRTVYGWAADAIRGVWGFFGTAFTRARDALVGILPDGSALAAGWTRWNASLAAELERTGPLAPVLLLIIELSILALVVLVATYAWKGVRFALTRDIRELK